MRKGAALRVCGADRSSATDQTMLTGSSLRARSGHRPEGDPGGSRRYISACAEQTHPGRQADLHGTSLRARSRHERLHAPAPGGPRQGGCPGPVGRISWAGAAAGLSAGHHFTWPSGVHVRDMTPISAFWGLRSSCTPIVSGPGRHSLHRRGDGQQWPSGIHGGWLTVGGVRRAKQSGLDEMVAAVRNRAVSSCSAGAGLAAGRGCC